MILCSQGQCECPCEDAGFRMSVRMALREKAIPRRRVLDVG